MPEDAEALEAVTIPELFADHPESIGEIRANKSESCSDWTPRDALISVLRQIDSGLAVDALVVCWRQNNTCGHDTGHFRSAAPDPFVSLGLLATTIHKMQD